MTIFQKIIDGEIPADKLDEDDDVLAFRDIQPQAPTHVLIIPRKPIVKVADMGKEDRELLGHLLWVAAEVARPDTGNTFYIMDEPTTGLHFADIQKLLRVVERLVESGNTVVIVEHNIDVINDNPFFCADPAKLDELERFMDDLREAGDSIGARLNIVASQVPPGLGEPVFDKLTADLAKALMSLPATRGVEFGLGFQSVSLMGSEHNDEYVIEDGNVKTRSNRSAGIQGGISNGEEIDLRIAFKPTATINHEQKTVTRDGESTTLSAKGRHDPCVLPRAVPMVEAMINLVLADHYLRQQSSQLH